MDRVEAELKKAAQLPEVPEEETKSEPYRHNFSELNMI